MQAGASRFAVGRPWRRWRSVAGLAMALLVAACGGGGGGGATSPPPAGGSDPLPNPASLRATDDASLTAYFREALGANSRNYLNTVWALDVMVAVAATAAAPAGSIAAGISGTTLQEAGVDEADLIKSDGSYVFNLESGGRPASSFNAVRRQRLNSGATPPALLPVDTLGNIFSTDVRGTGMYRDTDRNQLDG